MSSFYRDHADVYEEHASVAPYNALYDRPAVLDLLGDVRGLRVLDAGCGPGLHAEELVARGATVIGCDQSPGMIDRARARLGDGIGLHVHDLTQPITWLDEGSVDAVLLALVIHHIDDRVAALAQLRRVLRPGGHLVMSTHHPLMDWLHGGGSYFDVAVVEEVWRNGTWPVRYWRQPLTSWCDEIAAAGFLIERIVEPLPVAAMADADPESYAKLVERPSFIMFRVVRP